jgi:hypothetical protein
MHSDKLINRGLEGSLYTQRYESDLANHLLRLIPRSLILHHDAEFPPGMAVSLFAH